MAIQYKQIQDVEILEMPIYETRRCTEKHMLLIILILWPTSYPKVWYFKKMVQENCSQSTLKTR